MYFSSRRDAGYRLAQRLIKYRSEATVTVALNDGAAELGRQIAVELQCGLALFLSEPVELPGESIVYGEVNQSGRMSINSDISEGELQAFYSEYHGYIEEQKRVGMSRINRVIDEGGIVNEDMLRGRNVIVVTDGLSDGSSLESIADFLKPLDIVRLIIAAPVASVEGVDRAHVLGDELHILSVTDNFLDTDHYYDVNDVPSHEDIIASLVDLSANR